MNVVIVGHSFVRRLRDDLLPPLSRRGFDIDPYNPLKAAAFSTKLGIQHHFKGVYTASDGIIFIRDMKYCNSDIVRVSARIVVFDVGSNDLAHVDSVDPNRMLCLATQLTDIGAKLKNAVVIINCILPRTAGITCQRETFIENADLYNEYLKNICATSDNCVYNKLRGFRYIRSNKVQRRREVSEWSKDGIHCNTTASMKHYRSRIRQSIMAEVKRAQQLTTAQRGDPVQKPSDT